MVHDYYDIQETNFYAEIKANHREFSPGTCARRKFGCFPVHLLQTSLFYKRLVVYVFGLLMFKALANPHLFLLTRGYYILFKLKFVLLYPALT